MSDSNKDSEDGGESRVRGTFRLGKFSLKFSILTTSIGIPATTGSLAAILTCLIAEV